MSRQELIRKFFDACIKGNGDALREALSLIKAYNEKLLWYNNLPGFSQSIDINAGYQNPQSPHHNLSALQIALLTKNNDLALLLLNEPDISLTLLDGKGNTPLHLACLHANDTVAKTIFNKNFDNIRKYNDEQLTPLHLVCRENRVELLRYFLAKKIKVMHGAGNSFLEMYAQNPYLGDTIHPPVETLENVLTSSDIDRKDVLGNTPLHYAAKNGHTQIINTLLRGEQKSAKANPNKRNFALKKAIEMAGNNTEVIKAFEPVLNRIDKLRFCLSQEAIQEYQFYQPSVTPVKPYEQKKRWRQKCENLVRMLFAYKAIVRVYSYWRVLIIISYLSRPFLSLC